MASKTTAMSLRDTLNAEFDQQAVRFAENFAETERAEFLQENAARRQFEQQQTLQKNRENRPLASRVALLILALILFVAGLVYWQTGRYQTVSQGEAALASFLQQQQEKAGEQRNDDYILTLQNRLRANPNEGDVWFELAQAYLLNNEFEHALISYRNAQGILGESAAIFGGMATAEYYRNRHQMNEQVKQWIELALKKDKNESASLLLLGSDAFLHNEFKQAIQYWERVLESENTAVDRRELIRSIQAAKARLVMLP